MSLLVCIPCYGSLMHVGCCRSVLSIRDEFDARGVAVDFLITAGESAITRGRSNMVSAFLQTDYQRMLFLDADIEIAGADVWRLYERDDCSIRGAAVNLKTLDMTERLSAYTLARVRCKRAEMPNDPFEVRWLGGSVMMIERRVLERLTELWRDLKYDCGTHLFHEIVEDGALLTEDYAFCARAYNSGFSIWCDPTIVVGHWEGRVQWRF